ncbi:hypothetical protein BH11ACT8_BH11ACT8_24450 [soil metagenome]
MDTQPRTEPLVARRGRAAGWLAVAAPLAWVPGGFTRFGPATLLVVALACAVAAAATGSVAGRLPRRLVLVGAAWLVVLALACLTGDTPVASLVGRWPRYEGLPVLVTYAGACWVGARVVERSDDGAQSLARAVGVLALVLAGFSLLDLAGTSPVGAGGLARSGSLLGNATDQGAVAMMAALLLAGRVLRRPLADVDPLPALRHGRGLPFAGVIYAHQLRLSNSHCIEDLALLALVGVPEDVADRVVFLPL